ncbi:MAG: bi-domain-containing oxidoreductase [Solirubrobacterales bacterium]|nr:bi-domain-containing oxidoreductase [Solirubrobacterales bacterium]
MTQRLRNGRIELIDVPWPDLEPNGVIVDVRASVLSVGTEKVKVATGRSNLVQKARKRPDDVRKVLDKARSEGIARTVRAVRSKLDEPSPLGYSSAGVVVAVGSRVSDLAPGDRVACGGEAIAVHAEVAQVPGNLCVPIPGGLPFVEAAFATVGSIALQGVRQADVRIGERVAVIGLGLVGQITGKILKASGCVVTGMDLDAGLVNSAVANGACHRGFPRDALDAGIPVELDGVDAVIITAATQSPDPANLAATLCRDRGRVVIVGDVRIDIQREPYFAKEIDLRLSRSYGPGRYDTEYEQRGLDYPIGYVRWTERRNMAEVLRLAEAGLINLDQLVSRTVPMEEAERVFDELMESERSPLGVALTYRESTPPSHRPMASVRRIDGGADRLVVGMIGAGNFASQVVAPGLQAAGFQIHSVASTRGLSAVGMAERVNAKPSEVDAVLSDPAIGTVAILTRHSSHAELSVAALEAGKAVFVEKPPALDWAGLEAVAAARDSSGLPVFVGFNRRFAPLLQQLRSHVSGRGPIEATFRVNSPLGFGDHWLDDADDGGGRLLGEGCHFVDLACWLVDGLPTQVKAVMLPDQGAPLALARRFSISLGFSDGSIVQVLYGAAAANKLGKERFEASAGGNTARVDDFQNLELIGPKGTKSVRARGRDKGHSDQFKAIAQAVRNPNSELPGPDPLATMAVALEALHSAQGLAAPVEQPPVR